MKKKSLIVIFSLLGTAVLVAGGFILAFLSKSIDYNVSERSDILEKITIERDINGVPGITAHSIDDIYFSIGFVHAQDRLMMLEYYRAISGAGLSAIAGEEAEILDRIIKVSGITRKARELEEKLPEPYKNYLASYAKGVNLFKKNNISDREKLNRPWDVADVISILLLREWAASYLNNSENLFQFPQSISYSLLNTLFPGNLLYYFNQDEKRHIKVIRKIKTVLEKYIGTYDSGYAFSVPSGRTERRKPLIGYSFDSNLNVYPDLYPVSIKFGEIVIRGITFAGLPFIYAGNNQNISFFGFSINTDINDFLMDKIKIIDGQPHFLTGTGWKKVMPVRVPIPDKEYRQKQDIVWKTDNGYVLSDILKDEVYRDSIVTLPEFYPDESYIMALMKIPFSENINKAIESVKNVHSYPRVYLFSDNTVCSKVYSGKVPGTPVTNRIFHNGLGFSSRLNDITSVKISNRTEAAGSWILNRSPFPVRDRSLFDRKRIERLEHLLNHTVLFGRESAFALLKDNYSIYAEKLVPRLLSLLDSNPITSARLCRIYFKQWDMKMDAEKVAPLLFNIIMKNFIIETYEDDMGDAADTFIRGSAYNHYHFLLDKFTDLLREGKSSVFDNKRTEDIETVEITFGRAFINSLRYLNRKLGPIMENWKWGNIHRGHYSIPLKEESILYNLLYEIKDTPFSGGNSTLSSGAYLINFKPRLNSSLTGFFSGDESEFHMNYSYSVNPLSKFYYGKFQGEKRIKFNKMTKTDTAFIYPLK